MTREKQYQIANNNQYIKITYQSNYSSGVFLIKKLLYEIEEKKFLKRLKDCSFQISDISYTEYLMHYVSLKHRSLRAYVEWRCNKWDEVMFFDEDGHIRFKNKDEL